MTASVNTADNAKNLALTKSEFKRAGEFEEDMISSYFIKLQKIGFRRRLRTNTWNKSYNF